MDGYQGPFSCGSFDAPVLGGKGFLELLETHLGLVRPETPTAERVACYLGHLRRWDNQERFYTESLRTDSVGTAAKLLEWRDEWCMGGWNGTTHPDSPRRILELALVEQSAHEDIAPGEADRLATIAAAMVSQSVAIESVRLVDPLESYPWAWRQVLRHLPVSQWEASPQGEGQLRALQELALDAVTRGTVEDRLSPITDGSVLLVQAASRETAESWLSSVCTLNQAERLIICEAQGDSLDATLAATGTPACGFSNFSSLRPSLQALSLALETCWSPVNVSGLIEFLSHPIGPFSRGARSRLARAVVKQPGIGSEAWWAAKDEVGAMENGADILEEIAFWLEGERWTREEGVPVDALVDRTRRVLKALSRRVSDDDFRTAALAPGIEQCSAVLASLEQLKRQGLERLIPRQLEQLISQATDGGTPCPTSVAQVGCMRSTTLPSACIETADEVIWWMPSTPNLPRPLPWSETETEALTELGVEVRNPHRELVSLARQWLRPLLAAKKRFLLVLPPQGSEEHPFCQLIASLAPHLTTDRVDLDAALNSCSLRTLSQPLERMPLPEIPRCIELESRLPLAEEPHSYTSLTELFNNPAFYVIKRVAGLRPTTTLVPEDDKQLLGTLGHRVFELLFGHTDVLSWSNARALEWFQENVDELLKKEGALLLTPEAGISHQRFKTVCEDAICSLLDHLRSANAIRVRTEVELGGALGEIALTGKVDLLVELSDARFAALDAKWRGDKRYSSILSEGRHLQLALYSTLIEQTFGTAPAALGYFLLESGSLFVSDAGVFPHAQIRRPRTSVGISELLNQALASYRWRTSELLDGRVEVVSGENLDEFQGPPGTLPVEALGPWHSDHLVLLGGWER